MNNSKLETIIKKKKETLEHRKKKLSLNLIISKLKNIKLDHRNFKQAIKRKKDRLSLIAECKKASPSKGILRANYDVEEIAKIYNSSKFVDAISVLTEENFFLGDIYHIIKAKTNTSLPILRKDFIIDEYQVYESIYYGADAILLIANILEKEQLKSFYKIAKDLGLEVLFEVHTKEDIDKVLELEPEIIGINNRDLLTFKIDIHTTENLIKFIPKDITIISESGILSNKDISYLYKIGVDAVLIGTYFMQQENIQQAIENLFKG